jgi:hypothetical protein
VALYQPLNGWDATVQMKTNAGNTYQDTSEVYGVKFDESWNLQERKRLGTKYKEWMPGEYEANATASAYFLTSNMVTLLYGIDALADRDHSSRTPTEFDLRINFVDFPIQVKAQGIGSPTGVVNLIGYVCVKCMMGSDAMEFVDGEYIEKPIEFMVAKIVDIYDVDSENTILAFSNL